MIHTDYQQAELQRRFGLLLMLAEVVAVQPDKLLTVRIDVHDNQLTIPNLTVLGRDPARMTGGEECWLLSPQGELAQALVLPVRDDPALGQLAEQVTRLEQQLNQLQAAVQSVA